MCIGGDQDRVLEEVLEELKPRFVRIGRRFRLPLEDFEDAFQATVLAYLEHQANIRNIRAWLLVAFRNRCLIHCRQQRRLLYRSVDSALLETFGAEEPASAETLELRRSVRAAVAAVSPSCREVLTARYVENCSAAATAASSGYRPSGIYKVLQRCLSAVARNLAACGMIS